MPIFTTPLTANLNLRLTISGVLVTAWLQYEVKATTNAYGRSKGATLYSESLIISSSKYGFTGYEICQLDFGQIG
jgi:hypothetical protein